MKKPSVDGGFILCLVLNMIFQLGWTVPAWVLLILHFIIGISLWWFVAALAVWFLIILGITIFLAAVTRTGSDGTQLNMTVEEQRARREEIREKSRNMTVR